MSPMTNVRSTRDTHSCSHDVAQPFLKWAGGKTQLLDKLLAAAPSTFRRYIEPFLGGGALFFALRPESAVIADANPELINLYVEVRDSVDKVINVLQTFEVSEKQFYDVRALEFENLSPVFAAARTIYLNKTCYNGLYRVNRKGQFNVPYGHYQDPTVCQPELLKSASKALRDVDIRVGDYRETLHSLQTRQGDFIYLDPPYLPVARYSDFRRYTREQFHEDDHRDLAREVHRLYEEGCFVVLTNSNHPLTYELFAEFDLTTYKTKRYISSSSKSRRGEDVIVIANPELRRSRSYVSFTTCAITNTPQRASWVRRRNSSVKFVKSQNVSNLKVSAIYSQDRASSPICSRPWASRFFQTTTWRCAPSSQKRWLRITRRA